MVTRSGASFVCKRHTHSRGATVLVTLSVPGTVGRHGRLCARCRWRSLRILDRILECLLVLVEEGVAVPLELERELRAAAAHLKG